MTTSAPSIFSRWHTAWRTAATVSVFALPMLVAACHKNQAPVATSPTAPAARPALRPPETARLEPQPLNPVQLSPAPAANSVVTRPRTPRELFRASVDSMVDDVQFRNAHWGILIVDPERGDTVYAHNADKLFMPASNQKIVTGSVGLTQLGADFQWRTVVELRGTRQGETFAGNVIVHGRGDPTWSDYMHGGDAQAAFAPVADALSARGIKRIVGEIVAEGNTFGDAPYGFGWAYDDFDFGYSAPVDELFYNEGFFTLKVKAPAGLAKPVVVSSNPLLTYPKVIVRAISRERSDSVGDHRDLDVSWDSTASVVIVGGSMPMGDSANIEVAYRHPNDAALAAMSEFLVSRGLRIVAPTYTGKTKKPKAGGADARG